MKVVRPNSEVFENTSRLLKLASGTSRSCWEWKGHKIRGGYGLFRFFGKMALAHRASYRIFKSEIPTGLELHHTCENRSCVNPEHLVALTRKEHFALTPNNPINRNRVKDMCVNGHAYDSRNTYFRPNRYGRQCRSCNRERTQLRRAGL